MQNKNIILGLAAVIVIGSVIAFTVTSHSSATNQSTDTSYTDTSTDTTGQTPITSAPHETTNPNAGGTTSSDTGSASTAGTSYTMAQVATHNSGTSCWTAISGNVYDVTTWINQHPGGSDAILSLCGIDGTAAFTAQHGGQSRPENELKTFFIGTLSK